MKAGVAISPRRIRIVPARALPSVAEMEKEKRSLKIPSFQRKLESPYFFLLRATASPREPK